MMLLKRTALDPRASKLRAILAANGAASDLLSTREVMKLLNITFWSLCSGRKQGPGLPWRHVKIGRQMCVRYQRGAMVSYLAVRERAYAAHVGRPRK